MTVADSLNPQPHRLGSLCLQLPLLGALLPHGVGSFRTHLASVGCSQVPGPLLSVAGPT